MFALIISFVAIVLAVVAIVYAAHCAITFQTFNDGIKVWAENLDNSTNAAIQRAARQILKELDEKISDGNLIEQSENENVKPLNEEDFE